MKAFCGVWLPTLLAFLAIHCCYAKEWNEKMMFSLINIPDEKLARVWEIMRKFSQGDTAEATTIHEISSILDDSTFNRKFINLEEFFAKILKGRFNKTDCLGRTTIYDAFKYELDLKRIKLLVKLGANLHHLDKLGRNLFLQLISCGVEITPQILKYLLSEGVSPFLISKEGKSLISEVIVTKNKAVIQALLDNGIDVNAKDDLGHTLLQYLVIISSKEGSQSVEEAKPLMTYLIEQGADVNFFDETLEHSLLHFAAMHKSLEMMKFLLEKGAKANVLNKEGLTPAQTIRLMNGVLECEENGATCSRKTYMLVDYTPDITLVKNWILYDNEELAREDLLKILEYIENTDIEGAWASFNKHQDAMRESKKKVEEMQMRMKEMENHQKEINRVVQIVQNLKKIDFRNEL